MDELLARRRAVNVVFTLWAMHTMWEFRAHMDHPICATVCASQINDINNVRRLVLAEVCR